jgi:Oxidoreductase molybdopterin binding domain
MPEGLDAVPGRRPMPLSRAMAEDKLLALVMNGEVLPPDHGYPARVVVSGWLGAGSIKWVGRIQGRRGIAARALEHRRLRAHRPKPSATRTGARCADRGDAGDEPRGAVMARSPGAGPPADTWPRVRRGGPDRVGRVSDRQRPLPGCDAAAAEHARHLGQLLWDARPGEHVLWVRATDDRGRRQPDSVPQNDLCYLYNAVFAHPMHVGAVS